MYECLITRSLILAKKKKKLTKNKQMLIYLKKKKTSLEEYQIWLWYLVFKMINRLLKLVVSCLKPKSCRCLTAQSTWLNGDFSWLRKRGLFADSSHIYMGVIYNIYKNNCTAESFVKVTRQKTVENNSANSTMVDKITADPLIASLNSMIIIWAVSIVCVSETSFLFFSFRN